MNLAYGTGLRNGKSPINKRGRLYVHSPDADYQAKPAYIQTSLQTTN